MEELYLTVLDLIGPKPLTEGAILYHVSNTRHTDGFLGHKRMCLTQSDSGFVPSQGIDYHGKPVYNHRCRVVDPNFLRDHTAIGILEGIETALERGANLDEALSQGVIPSLIESAQTTPRWYEAVGKGAVEVIGLR